MASIEAASLACFFMRHSYRPAGTAASATPHVDRAGYEWNVVGIRGRRRIRGQALIGVNGIEW
jgi:hypothetical protein